MSGPVARRAAVRLLRPLAARGGVLAVAATSAGTSCLGVAGQLFAPSSFAATCGFRALTTKAPVPFAAKLVLEEEEEEGEANACGNQGKAPSIPDAVAAATAAAVAPGTTCLPLLDASAVIASPSYSREFMESISPTHLPPASARQRFAHAFIKTVRAVFDKVTGYDPTGSPSEAVWIRRIIFLETVAAVPGLVAGSLRTLHSLRLLKHDGGFIAQLLAESENERMHLYTFMKLRDPGPFFRTAVLLAQGVFWNAFFLLFLASPKTCHALVGYLEEEAVKTYTHALAEIDAGRLWPPSSGVKPPGVAIRYWKLAEDATMRDLVLAVRADEYDHARVNHTFSLLPDDAPNPFVAPENSSTAGMKKQKVG